MKKSTLWAWAVALVVAAGVALVLGFVISQAGEGSSFLERHFVWLFWLNVAVAVLLALVIGFVALRLSLRLRLRKFGSRLLLKLAGIFAIVGLLPGLVIYTVSYQFVSRTIAVWFDAKVAGALDAGLALGRGTLEALQADVSNKTRVAAERLPEGGASLGALALERLREQFGASEVALVGAGGQVLSVAGSGEGGAPVGVIGRIGIERPPPALMRQARTGAPASVIEGLDEESLAPGAVGSGPRVRALARLPRRDVALTAGEDLFLMVVQPLPRALASHALVVQAAYSDYQQRALARDSLRRMYLGTLTLSLFLAVFAAVLLAILLGNQLVRPLLLLADGVRQVAAGDLTDKPVFGSADELGGLTRSFADMTRQLAEARGQVQRGVSQLEGARTRLQTILDTLSAGVIVFDRQAHIDTVNPGATRILRLPLSAWRGRPLNDIPQLQTLAAEVLERFETLERSPEEGERDHWQESFEFTREDGTVLTLLVRGAHLPGEARLLVFDDISEVVSAQRSAAWAEVARRLAHEIKNPLTPIQLSAERMQHRLESKLEGNDRSLLLRSVSTIVAQVQAMLTLVNEFRSYARLPAAQLKPLDLNALAVEVLALYGQAQDHGRLVQHLAPDLPAVMGDATQLRQVIHNLVQNGLDAVTEAAGASATPGAALRADARVVVSTTTLRDESGVLRGVRLAVTDNGPGFAEKVLKRALEPYVTTKVKGTGLGLPVVKKIADEHGARLRLVNLHLGDDPEARVIGARVSLSFSNLASAQAAPPALPVSSGSRSPAAGDATH